MNVVKKISPEWALRMGFGVMYLYSGVDLFRHPTAWYWALPVWLKNAISAVMPLSTYIRLQGALEIVLALALLACFLKPAIIKWVALASTLEMTAILLLSLVPFSAANFSITFRDIGLLGGALALFMIVLKKESSNQTPQQNNA